MILTAKVEKRPRNFQGANGDKLGVFQTELDLLCSNSHVGAAALSALMMHLCSGCSFASASFTSWKLGPSTV